MLVFQAVILQLDVVMLLAQQVPIAPSHLLGLLVIVAQQELLHLAGKAGRQHDDALLVLPQQLEVDAGLSVESLQPGLLGEVAHVHIALVVFRQHHQMEAVPVGLGKGMIQMAPGGHIEFAADDAVQLHGMFLVMGEGLAGGGQGIHAAHGAVVRQGNCGHAKLHRLLDDGGDRLRAIQKAVVGVDVQMHEGRGCHEGRGIF